VVIAKSEWKKLGKWMKEVGKEGLIKVKETKGEVIVTGYVLFSYIYHFPLLPFFSAIQIHTIV
jgi:hypothetical protein